MARLKKRRLLLREARFSGHVGSLQHKWMPVVPLYIIVQKTRPETTFKVATCLKLFKHVQNLWNSILQFHWGHRETVDPAITQQLLKLNWIVLRLPRAPQRARGNFEAKRRGSLHKTEQQCLPLVVLGWLSKHMGHPMPPHAADWMIFFFFGWWCWLLHCTSHLTLQWRLTCYCCSDCHCHHRKDLYPSILLRLATSKSIFPPFDTGVASGFEQFWLVFGKFQPQKLVAGVQSSERVGRKGGSCSASMWTWWRCKTIFTKI